MNETIKSDVVADTLAYMDKQARTGYLNENQFGGNLHDPMHKILVMPGNLSDRARLIFSFKETPAIYWVYGHDGWFRQEKGGPGAGYGIAFKTFSIGGKVESKKFTNGETWIVTVKFTYLPSSEDIDDPSKYERGTGKIYVDKTSLDHAGITDIKDVIKYIDKCARNNVWFP